MPSPGQFFKKGTGTSGYWAEIRSSYYRRGAYVPWGAYTKPKKGSEFVSPEDKSFNERLNFSCSEIGALASDVFKETDKNGAKFYIYGYGSYLPVGAKCPEDEKLGKNVPIKES